MSKRKPFSVHDLYPADYCFDYDAFEADPENYVFTPEDCAYCYPTNSNPSISHFYDRLISQITIRHYFSLSLNAAFFIA